MDSAGEHLRLIVIPGELDWPFTEVAMDPDRYRELGRRLMHDARLAPNDPDDADDLVSHDVPPTSLDQLEPLPRIGPNGPPAFFTNPEDEIAYRKALGGRDPYVVFGVTKPQRQQAEFNPDQIDLETWPGPWCPECTEEPVELESERCPRCVNRARDKAARWRR